MGSQTPIPGSSYEKSKNEYFFAGVWRDGSLIWGVENCFELEAIVSDPFRKTAKKIWKTVARSEPVTHNPVGGANVWITLVNNRRRRK